jgi:hypothetical protein
MLLCYTFQKRIVLITTLDFPVILDGYFSSLNIFAFSNAIVRWVLKTFIVRNRGDKSSIE